MMFLWMLHAAVAAVAAASSDPVREETVFYLGSAWPVLRPLALELGRRFVEAVRLMEPVVETFQTVWNWDVSIGIMLTYRLLIGRARLNRPVGSSFSLRKRSRRLWRHGNN
jgi:hypothetical protein